MYVPEHYPWQSTNWDRAVDSLERLPHATLITGTEGTGKFRFATRLAMALLCDSADDRPCAKCRNCHLFSASTHPDLHVLSSEAKLDLMDAEIAVYAERYLEDESARSKRKVPRSSIVVNQIRALIQNANVKPHLSENKVFLIDPVDSMTIASANSLLKVLEEPPKNTYFILIAESAHNLLPTISSRCQEMVQSDPDRTVAEEWLRLQKLGAEKIDAILDSGKGPLVGLRLANDDKLIQSVNFSAEVLQFLQNNRKGDVFSLVESGIQLGESECLAELQLLVSKLIRAASDSNQSSASAEALLHELTGRMDVRQLYSVYDHIGLLRKQIRAGGMDKTLAIEDSLLAIEGVIN